MPDTSEPRIIHAPVKDLGGFGVRRALPSLAQRKVGPFLFFDHIGPATFAPGEGIDVRPHPHIGLATVTYLFEGEIIHRDSLGFEQPIQPGAVNWMIAGRGIVHSERTHPERRATGARLHGLQLWIGLPRAQEEMEPSFFHHPASTLPEAERSGAKLRAILGEAYGLRSPVRVLSPLFYVDAALAAGAELPLPEEYEERALYVLDGEVSVGDASAGFGAMVVFEPGGAPLVRADRDTRIVLLGGAPLDGERYLDWNFVSSSRERLARAREDWKARRFPVVPGDEVEFIPLPE